MPELRSDVIQEFINSVPCAVDVLTQASDIAWYDVAGPSQGGILKAAAYIREQFDCEFNDSIRIAVISMYIKGEAHA